MIFFYFDEKIQYGKHHFSVTGNFKTPTLFIANILEKNILKLGKFDYDNHPSMQNIESYQ
jgi:hypothetical protein